MPERRREVGFLTALGKSSVVSLLWPEGFGAVVLGLGGASLLVEYSDLETRLSVAADALVVLAPLLGVVLAALTLVITVSTDDYVRLLSKTSSGVVGFYRPFIIAIGCEVWTILLLLTYRVAAAAMGEGAEAWMFRLVGFLVVFSVLDILAVGRTVLMHATTRARIVDTEESRLPSSG